MQKQKGCLLLAGLLFCLILSGNASSQSNSKYVDDLDQEAKSLRLDTETEIPVEALENKGTIIVPGSVVGGAIKEMTPGLTVQQFEVVLKNNYMGSFLFYKRLSNRLKDDVFQFYQENPDSTLIREHILKLSKK